MPSLSSFLGSSYIGAQGVQGIQGNLGVQGIQGIQGNPGVNYDKSVVVYTATDGQTTFSATYSVGFVDVYLNGIRLSPSQYTASNGTSVVLSVGASLDDIVELISYTGGTLGAQGPQGPQGTTGIQGSEGTQGTTGAGTQGIQGPQGTTGIQGNEGTQGPQGTTGIQGSEGTQGIQGTQGVQGTQGIISPVAGSANQVVYKDGSNNPTGSDNLTFTGTNLGIGTNNPTSALQVVGVVSATSYFGDGSQLTGLTKVLTIDTRTGIVTFSFTTSSFNISGRTGNIPINV
jgi:hypothetical protein